MLKISLIIATLGLSNLALGDACSRFLGKTTTWKTGFLPTNGGDWIETTVKLNGNGGGQYRIGFIPGFMSGVSYNAEGSTCNISGNWFWGNAKGTFFWFVNESDGMKGFYTQESNDPNADTPAYPWNGYRD